MGPIRQPIALCLLLVFGLVYLALWKGVKSTGKVEADARDVANFALIESLQHVVIGP